MSKIEGYLKKLVLWMRILIKTVLVITLVSIAVWNFFAPPRKGASERVKDKFLNELNSENITGLVVEGDSGRCSSTSTTPPKGSSPE